MPGTLWKNALPCSAGLLLAASVALACHSGATPEEQRNANLQLFDTYVLEVDSPVDDIPPAAPTGLVVQ